MSSILDAADIVSLILEMENMDLQSQYLPKHQEMKAGRFRMGDQRKNPAVPC
tara:strand:- start:757 stop:912 length:156 start_codon:yes stop_codon:yes gene_type:complete